MTKEQLRNKAVGIGLQMRDSLIVDRVERKTAEMFAHVAQSNFFKGGTYVLNNLWKDAQGEDLPEIDRDVIVLVEAYGGYKVVFAHRPKHFCGEKELDYHQPIIYDKGGWNMPDVVYWLDLDLPIKE